MSTDRTTGVVLSGGGANGAYEVGVLKALAAGASPGTGFQPIDPGIYTGTSVGAYNATYMASRPGRPAGEVVAELERIWLERIADTLERCGNGVYRLRGAPFQFFDPGCLLHPLDSLLALGRDAVELGSIGLVKGGQFLASDAPLESRVLSLLDLSAFISESPFTHLAAATIDLQGLAASDKTLTIAASNWKLGVLRLFDKQEIAGAVGVDAVLASAALPGIFPAVTIDSVPYVDGGVLLNTPMKPAIDDGAETIHVIFLDPLIENIPLTDQPSSLDSFFRLFAIIWAARVRHDVALAEGITQTLELLETESVEHASLPVAKQLLRHGRRVYQRLVEADRYRKMTVHVYRPQTDLGGGEGLLDFKQRRLRDLVALGFADATSHDCRASGCVLHGESWPASRNGRAA